ncbi:hypothetical protein [Novosphingobium mangrovi (ex Huang et al. 2023)]|uniref:Lipoprotein n=1 Tax=Novosphingobium mangrovi (ex Huang et al. 2023) TaxID=2976432 RepID=A0ABT2I5B8_9SPHN|nr:hypothetical protein [Novosphingobium mangrovi (ex Huang et al. 2023)]MCT2399793.1 hypothetical protein [Novosphingobium mangrovi (ex Huang et al. 2023)]
MQLFKIAASALVLLGLGSCSQLFLVKAALIDGELVFTSSDDDVTAYPWCWGNLTIVDEDGRAVWEFEVPYGAFSGRDECGPNFPIRYGQAPPKAETMVEPQALESGKTYVITGRSAGFLEGAFEFQKTDAGMKIQNLSPGSEIALRARDAYFAWQRDHDPSRVSQRPTEYSPFVEPPPVSIPHDYRKGTSGRDDLTWVLGPDEWWNMPSLSYQDLNGERTKFNLWCRYTNGPVYARVTPPAKKGASLEISSGRHHMAVRVIGAGNPGERTRIDAVLPWDAALFRSFAETGNLTLETARGTIEMNAINNKERAVVSRFFQLCAGQLPHPVNEKNGS